MRSSLPLVTLVLTALAMPCVAHAQTNEMIAQSLFEEGRELMTKGRYPEACAKLAESQRLDPAGGTLLNLGLCREKEGRLATAHSVLASALGAAIKDGRADREQIAREHVEALAKRMPRLSVHVTTKHSELRVLLDGTRLHEPAWDVPTGVDPGTHVVEANAPGLTPFHAEVVLREGETRTVVVPALERKPAAAPPEPAPSAAPEATRSNPLWVAALLASAGGVTGAAVGAIGWAAGASRRAEHCLEDRGYCDPDGLSAASQERTFAWVATISLGVAALGFGSLLLLPRRVTIGASPTPGGAVAGMQLALP